MAKSIERFVAFCKTRFPSPEVIDYGDDMEEIFGNIRQVVDNPLTPEQLAEIQKELDELMTHAENQTGDVIVILFEEIFETSSPVNDDLDEYRYN